MKRRAGIIQLTTDGVRLQCKGEFTYNLGKPKRTTIVGSDGVHGFYEEPQASFIEGEITDDENLDLAALVAIEEATVVLQLAVGPTGPAKAIVLREAAFVAEGTGNTKEGNIGVRFEASEGEEIKP